MARLDRAEGAAKAYGDGIQKLRNAGVGLKMSDSTQDQQNAIETPVLPGATACTHLRRNLWINPTVSSDSTVTQRTP